MNNICYVVMIILSLSIPVVARSAGTYTPVHNYLWFPSTPTVPPINVVVDDTAETSVGINLPSASVATLVGARCSDKILYPPIEGIGRWWLQYPDGDMSNDGLTYTIDTTLSEWSIPDTDHVAGWSTVVSPVTKKTWSVEQMCYTVGGQVGWSIPGLTVRARLKINRASAIPGTYRIEIPVTAGYEENKGGSGGEWYKYARILQGMPKTNIIANVTVNSRCAFDASAIELNYGILSADTAHGATSNVRTVTVSCDPGTSLSATLLATAPSDMSSPNVTKCGDNGLCQLSFANEMDDNLYVKNIVVSGSEQLSIKSTYLLKKYPFVVAGAFEGSAILRILIN